MERGRRAAAERRPLERGAHAVLVEAVTALVHRAEQRVEVVVEIARRHPDVVRPDAEAERMNRRVESVRALLEAE